MNVPRELLAAYSEIVKNETDSQAAAQHLLNFLSDASHIAQVVQEAIAQARQRASAVSAQPTQPTQ